LYLGEISFKEALEELSAYLLYKSPPKCVFIVENALNQVFHKIGSKGLDKKAIGMWINLSERKSNIEASEHLVLIGEKIGL
jgi:hypothetical protein